MDAPVRKASRAGSWYPGSARECAAEIGRLLRARRALAEPEGEIVAAVVPHAGWAFSGATAALVFSTLARSARPETRVLFGAVHTAAVTRPAVWAEGEWETPLGAVGVDAELAAAMIDEAPGALAADPAAHRGEHSIEVQVPMVRFFLPEARIVPVAVPPEADAPAVGEAAARAVERLGRRAGAVASTDLTHYGMNFYGWAPAGEGAEALAWVKGKNDRAMIERILALDAAGVLEEARASRSACGPGAVAAAGGFARARGADRGTLLDYVTSYEVESRPGPPSDFVGYAGIVLERAREKG